jgi:hypothetical protein
MQSYGVNDSRLNLADAVETVRVCHVWLQAAKERDATLLRLHWCHPNQRLLVDVVCKVFRMLNTLMQSDHQA